MTESLSALLKAKAIAAETAQNWNQLFQLAVAIARLGEPMAVNDEYAATRSNTLTKLKEELAKAEDNLNRRAQLVQMIARIEGSSGGSGGGQVDTGAITAAIAPLDPDKYLGTLGLAADAPKGVAKPHYTSFPASDAGGWLRVISDFKLGALDLVDRQEWLCLTDGTKAGTPENWELIQQGDLDYQEIVQANSFTPPCIVRKTASGYVLANASSGATADIWLCIYATTALFRKANPFKNYYFKDHGLGADGEILRLSSTKDGALTTDATPIGAYLVILGRIVDKDNILWAPNLWIQEVLA